MIRVGGPQMPVVEKTRRRKKRVKDESAEDDERFRSREECWQDVKQDIEESDANLRSLENWDEVTRDGEEYWEFHVTLYT